MGWGFRILVLGATQGQGDDARAARRRRRVQDRSATWMVSLSHPRAGGAVVILGRVSTAFCKFTPSMFSVFFPSPAFLCRCFCWWLCQLPRRSPSASLLVLRSWCPPPTTPATAPVSPRATPAVRWGTGPPAAGPAPAGGGLVRVAGLGERSGGGCLARLSGFLPGRQPASGLAAGVRCGPGGRGKSRGAAAVRRFFEARLSPWRVLNADGSREGLITGYYEPLIKGSRNRSKAYPWPVHGVPDDLLTVDLGEVYPELKGQRVRGPSWWATRWCLITPAPRWPAWATASAPRPCCMRKMPSSCSSSRCRAPGRVELSDGSVVRLGYGDANGHPYQSIGRWLVDKGEIKLEQASMEGIKSLGAG
jgi:membrane-bound lytic murein transglycosylase A